MTCDGCRFKTAFGCDAGVEDTCPWESPPPEVVKPCPSCGRDIDGYEECPDCLEEFLLD